MWRSLGGQLKKGSKGNSLFACGGSFCPACYSSRSHAQAQPGALRAEPCRCAQNPEESRAFLRKRTKGELANTLIFLLYDNEALGAGVCFSFHSCFGAKKNQALFLLILSFLPNTRYRKEQV